MQASLPGNAQRLGPVTIIPLQQAPASEAQPPIGLQPSCTNPGPPLPPGTQHQLKLGQGVVPAAQGRQDPEAHS